MLENKILGYKNEISLKKNILNGLPQIFGRNMNIKKNMNDLENKLNETKIAYNEIHYKLSDYYSFDKSISFYLNDTKNQIRKKNRSSR